MTAVQEQEEAAVAPRAPAAVATAPRRPVEAEGEPEVAVELRGLVKRFGAVAAVRGLDLTMRRGETIALLGPNGAGKSTTINMLLGLTRPDAGEVRIFGQAPEAAITSGRVGAMLQDAGLMPGVQVGELLGFLRSLYPQPLPMAQLAEIAGLEDILGRRVDRLSGGQSQRVRFAAAIAGDPGLLLLDEPTSAMDVERRRAFWAQMRRTADAGKAILFATHYLEEADAAADRIVIIAGGRRVADGSGGEIKAGLGERRIRLTLDGADPAPLRALRGVTDCEQHGRRLILYCSDADAAVRDLARSPVVWHDLEVEPADLEEAFLRLTGEQS